MQSEDHQMKKKKGKTSLGQRVKDKKRGEMLESCNLESRKTRWRGQVYVQLMTAPTATANNKRDARQCNAVLKDFSAAAVGD
jgi:hypothetical protein